MLFQFRKSDFAVSSLSCFNIFDDYLGCAIVQFSDVTVSFLLLFAILINCLPIGLRIRIRLELSFISSPVASGNPDITVIIDEDGHALDVNDQRLAVLVNSL